MFCPPDLHDCHVTENYEYQGLQSLILDNLAHYILYPCILGNAMLPIISTIVTND